MDEETKEIQRIKNRYFSEQKYLDLVEADINYLLSLLSEKEKEIIKQDAKLRLQSTLVVSLERRIKELKDQLAYIKRKYDILG